MSEEIEYARTPPPPKVTTQVPEEREERERAERTTQSPRQRLRCRYATAQAYGVPRAATRKDKVQQR